jgi:hypothetical protein
MRGVRSTGKWTLWSAGERERKTEDPTGNHQPEATSNTATSVSVSKEKKNIPADLTNEDDANEDDEVDELESDSESASESEETNALPAREPPLDLIVTLQCCE